MQRVILVLAIILTLWPLAAAQVQKSDPLKVEAAIAPVYPQLAILSATGGDVVVQVKINAEGQVTSAKILEGPKLLQEASLSAARRWQFSSGEAEREGQLIFSFRVMPKNTSPSELTPIFKPPSRVEVRLVIPDIPSNSSHNE